MMYIESHTKFAYKGNVFTQICIYISPIYLALPHAVHIVCQQVHTLDYLPLTHFHYGFIFNTATYCQQ